MTEADLCFYMLSGVITDFAWRVEQIPVMYEGDDASLEACVGTWPEKCREVKQLMYEFKANTEVMTRGKALEVANWMAQKRNAFVTFTYDTEVVQVTPATFPTHTVLHKDVTSDTGN